MKLCKTGGVIAAGSQAKAHPLYMVGMIPAIRRIVQTFQQAGIFPIVIVTGSEEDKVIHEMAPYGVVFVRNTDPKTSELLASARLGLDFLKDKCERVIFTPVNVPLFSVETVRALLECDDSVVIPTNKRTGGHPIVMRREVISDILAYKGGRGLRGAIKALGAAPRRVEVNDRGVLINLNRTYAPEDTLKEYGDAEAHPVLRIQFERDLTFMNDRLKVLLFLIAGSSNLRRSSELAGLAYSNAWEMINTLETNVGYRVVERRRGGRGGGKTVLTEKGERFLDAYMEYERVMNQAAAKEFRERLICTNIV